MTESQGQPFSVEAGVLRVNKELDEIEPEELEHAVRQLAKSGAAAPVLDLGGVSFLPSYHVNGIRTVADECIRDGRSLTVRAQKNVKTMLERMGLGAVARLKLAE